MVEIIITSSILIALLILLRRLWRNKISKRLQYALWLLVAVRLLVPVTIFENPLSIMNMLYPMAEHMEEYAGSIILFEDNTSNYSEEIWAETSSTLSEEHTENKEKSLYPAFDGKPFDQEEEAALRLNKTAYETQYTPEMNQYFLENSEKIFEENPISEKIQLQKTKMKSLYVFGNWKGYWTAKKNQTIYQSDGFCGMAGTAALLSWASGW